MSVTRLPINRLNPAFLKALTHSYLESKQVQVPLVADSIFCKVRWSGWRKIFSCLWETNNLLRKD